jgi:hypothetical protein
MACDNEHYLHSTCGYKPRQFEQEHYGHHRPPVLTA